MTSNRTLWSFPPALNSTFVDAFNAGYVQPDETPEDARVYSILRATVQNLTVTERTDSAFQNDGWGGDSAVVSVGDTIDGAFKDTELRFYGMNCLLCKSGRGLGSVENACSNYTESNNVIAYTKKNGPTASLYLVLPDLDQYSSIPNQTCGLCMFTLQDPNNPLIFDDFSVPFPVQQQEDVVPKVFNATYPTGVAVPRPSNIPLPSLLPEPTAATKKVETNATNTNLIVGVVVGVLAAASLLMGLIIFLWTRRGHKKNPYRSPSVVTSSAPELRDRTPRSVPLQQVQAVVRRPDSTASEAPPAYHEAVRAKEAES